MNNRAMEAFGYYQMDTTRHESLDSALVFIDRAIDCDTNYYQALHNKFSILYETGRYDQCIATIHRIKSKSSTPVPLMIANEALCNYLLGRHQEYGRLKEIAIRESESQAKKVPNEQNAGQVLMIRAMLNGQDDALKYLEILRAQGFTAIDYAVYEQLIREMPSPRVQQSHVFEVAPR
jgi:tetratricopeptide (TPR) repeat protein